MNAYVVESKNEIKIARKNPKWVKDELCGAYAEIIKLRDLVDNYLVQKRNKERITVQDIELKELRSKLNWFSQKKNITPLLRSWFKHQKSEFARQLK